MKPVNLKTEVLTIMSFNSRQALIIVPRLLDKQMQGSN